jgi:ATP-dependent DNA ligase
MIEPIMFFGMGFLVASLIGLVIIPLLHTRAIQRRTLLDFFCPHPTPSLGVGTINEGQCSRPLPAARFRWPLIPPCVPTWSRYAPAGRDWVHEIKHDGYRLMVRRVGARVRLFTRRGFD